MRTHIDGELHRVLSIEKSTLAFDELPHGGSKGSAHSFHFLNVRLNGVETVSRAQRWSDPASQVSSRLFCDIM